MCSGEKEKNWNLFSIEGRMIGWAEPVFVELQSEPKRVERSKIFGHGFARFKDWGPSFGQVLFYNISPLSRGSNPTNRQLVLIQTPDHIEIDHRDRFLERPDRIVDVMLRTEQAFLF